MSDATNKALLFIHALTGLHPGSGAALGVVDLPVQRERHTQWPIIPGSTIKGILRDACRRRSDNNVFTLVGPETSDATAHAGALSFTDARILAFPVRSLRGVFAWVTCPAVLSRLNRDLTLMGMGSLNDMPQLGKDQVCCAEDSPLLVQQSKMILEEFEFSRTADATAVAEWIATHAVSDADTANRIKSHLAVLHDDDFTHFVRHATEVTARIGLDYQRKTVKDGALFYEEFLPPETLFYALVLAEDSRRPEDPKSASDVMEALQTVMPELLQIGGDETIGKGLCAVRLNHAKEKNHE